MSDETATRCLRCGDEIEQDALGWFCRGCDHRCDGRGRRLRRQPTKGQKALRRFNDRKVDDAAAAVEAVFGEGVTAEQQTLFRRRPARPARFAGAPWCKPCDAPYVMRVGRIMCWRCGVIYEPAV